MNLMEDQLTIRFPRELTQALKERAAQMQRKPSEVVRMAVREFLAVAATDGRHPAHRVNDLLGSLESGVPDLALRHREHILEQLRHGH